ncbi:LuxR C-terminal-related transcriptional regulator [Mesorhizobium tamadayense]
MQAVENQSWLRLFGRLDSAPRNFYSACDVGRQTRANLASITGTLTPLQRDVLRELRQGKANKVIALALDMHESTVKVHVRIVSQGVV